MSITQTKNFTFSENINGVYVKGVITLHVDQYGNNSEGTLQLTYDPAEGHPPYFTGIFGTTESALLDQVKQKIRSDVQQKLNAVPVSI